ncbi:prolipoprotein diacylglyceryl transferase [Mesoplasma florum L1]|uniref:Prolipoprotein diacylglyceryl transferase n=1 Tax=Mesoplasma florum (strain ATCC 33453 / NBRC 100688 / NCTC 11704 / L1) TaxID=265311 RepID=Q6F252_MESFL|nr:prolipoprotein diacylglyceryl transferase family protein [Mesoplasma florum]AAT75421.1 prolipoprotein diacylglyceryl transferase [Mesoplasma florum L1]AVN60748.1 diacylglyceryl transferase [Mesoplasma florum]
MNIKDFKINKISFDFKRDKLKWISIGLWASLFIVVIVLFSVFWATKNVNWTQGDSFSEPVHWGGVEATYGGIGIYPMAMTLGMIVAILFTLYKFWKKGLNVTELSIGIAICIPISLMGASFFGKLNADSPGVNANGVGFWGLFAFWNAGMAIHGGVYGGLLAGLILFYFVGRKSKTSMLVYADAIVPNILLGQAIGRWGNFFNHEVMGAPVGVVAKSGTWGTLSNVKWEEVGSHYKFLPDWISRNLMVQAKTDGTLSNGVSFNQGDLVQLSPIFLYESLSLLAAWVIITFIIPNITKWISKKPWKVETGKYNYSLSFSIKQWFMPWQKSSDQIQSARDIWNLAYFRNIDEEAKQEYLKSLELNRTKYLKPKEINKANKLNEYVSTKAGVECFAYFFAWNFVRFFLELSRPDDHLFVMYDKPLSLSLILISAMIGLIGMIASQYWIPILFRKNGYLYEKEYFSIN